ncbi:MAG: AbrB/MazE/SpoVT family DNA-binding domain-containing protein [Rhodospirillaceae bacterium]|nr:AbrB/MazE/SpoVT family DNA-binding domain-containing protein [Rhodospirillaceae bacterium]
MSDIATLSTKYQISIPKQVREARNWKPGQKFAFLHKESGVLIVPVPTFEDLRGAAKGATITSYRDREDRY